MFGINRTPLTIGKLSCSCKLKRCSAVYNVACTECSRCCLEHGHQFSWERLKSVSVEEENDLDVVGSCQTMTTRSMTGSIPTASTDPSRIVSKESPKDQTPLIESPEGTLYSKPLRSRAPASKGDRYLNLFLKLAEVLGKEEDMNAFVEKCK